MIQTFEEGDLVQRIEGFSWMPQGTGIILTSSETVAARIGLHGRQLSARQKTNEIRLHLVHWVHSGKRTSHYSDKLRHYEDS